MEWVEEEPPELSAKENYQSAEQHKADLEAAFLEERDLDMVEGPHSKLQAAEICGCTPEEIIHGPMAAVEESDKVRTLYDGSVGGQNDHIRKNTEEKTTSPAVHDCLRALHWCRHAAADPGTPVAPEAAKHWPPPHKDEDYFILKADVTKAHRRIKVKRKDWKYQVAKLDGKYRVNKVGIYGMSSAQLYWGRMAALLLRILYALFPTLDWGFVYVDDFAWLLRGSMVHPLSTAILVTLLALGLPLSWKKTCLSMANIWLGYQLDTTTATLLMARSKHILVDLALQRLEAGECFSADDIASILGRCQWATAICPTMKAFLQPFWAWKQACKSSWAPENIGGMPEDAHTRQVQEALTVRRHIPLAWGSRCGSF